MTDSITSNASAITFSGEKSVSVFQYIMIAGALELYGKTGMKANRAYTPTAMIAKTNQLTGGKFKRGQYFEAAAALRKAAAEIRATIG